MIWLATSSGRSFTMKGKPSIVLSEDVSLASPFKASIIYSETFLRYSQNCIAQ